MGLILQLTSGQSLCLEFSPYGNPLAQLLLGDKLVMAEVVASPEKLYLGLSHRDRLPEGHGMLFVMPKREYQHFCMRGMRFPIDIIWLASDRVVGVTADLAPSEPGVFSSPEPVSLVLEVPGGWCRRHNVKTNTPVTLPDLPIFP